MITMLLGGLWHGAGWNFVLWGALHGGYLTVNHLWRGSELGNWVRARTPTALYTVAAWTLTMVAVVIAWVFFRAESFQGAIGLLTSMAGLAGAGSIGIEILPDPQTIPWMMAVMLLIVVGFPNAPQLTENYRPVLFAAKELAGSGFGLSLIHI